MATWRVLGAGARERGIAAHEVAILVSEYSGLDRRALLADEGTCATPAAARAFRAAVTARCDGAPLQHILGHWSFRTLELATDSRALVPRPETELLVEHTLAVCRKLATARPPGTLVRVADLGTGSGAVALSLVAEEPRLKVLALDVSLGALELAASNRARCERSEAKRCVLLASDWWSAVSPAVRFDCIVSNPPYLAASEWPDLDVEVRDHEPRSALVAGATGIEAITALLSSASVRLAADGVLVMEIAPAQAREVVTRARTLGLRAEIRLDLAERARFAVVERASA